MQLRFNLLMLACQPCAWRHPQLLAILLIGLSGLCTAQASSQGKRFEIAYRQIVCRKYAADSPGVPSLIRKELADPISKTFRDAEGRVWQAKSRGLVETLPSGQRKILTGKDGLPILVLTGVVGGPDGRLWLATRQGAICYNPGAAPDRRWFYFWGKRYLSDNDVFQIVAERDRAWIRTRAGISRIEFKPFTLAQKSRIFLRRVRARHNRYGYVADCELLRPGDTASFLMAPNDNDGLWTSIYVATECFRYAATGSPQALWNARRSLAALLRLVSITGIPGFPARSLIHRGDYRGPDGEWHWTPNGEWEWKGDTSSDELVGHFFAYSVAYDLLPDNGDRAAIRKAAGAIAGGLLAHGLKLVGYGGRVTTWGRYNPEYFQTSQGSEDKALDSLELLSHLRVAYHVTGDARFLAAYHQIGNQGGYVRNVMHVGDEQEQVNYSDEELAFLSFYPLLRLETDPGLKRQYEAALAKLWRRVRNENNPLWNFIYAASTGAKSYGCGEALETLERIPLSTVSWTVKNSQRDDLVILSERGRHRERQSRVAIPPDERYVTKWNGNPFQLDGGDKGRSEDDGAFFLLPYWLGRYDRLLPCSQ